MLPKHNYTCSECGAAAVVVDGQVIRSCEHDAPITANLVATCTGEGDAK